MKDYHENVACLHDQYIRCIQEDNKI